MKVLYLSPDAVQREFEPIGEVSSFDELLQYFDSFDWDNGKKIIARRESLDLPYFPQILRFQRSSTDFVDIQPARKDEFFISCVNGELVFEDEIRGDVTRSEFSIEEFLSDFWSENLLDKYNFEEIGNAETTDLHSESNFSALHLWPLALVLFLSFMILDKKSKPVSASNILWSLFPLLFVLPYLILLLQYFRYNRNSTLNINKKDRTLTIVTRGTPRTIRTRDITKSKIVINNAHKSLTRGWGYLLLELGPQDKIVITNFLYENIESLGAFLGLKPVHFNSIYPLIMLGTKSDEQLLEEKDEHELKVQEFVEKWSGKTKEELVQIRKNPTTYAAHAIEAATILLKKK